MDEWGELSQASIVRIACKAKDGKADPDEARRLLEFFCECADTQREIPPELLRHLRAAFREYLAGTRTLEAALGLVPKGLRKRGQPKADKERQQMLATEVLKRRLAGLSLQDAVSEVSETSPALLKASGYKASSLGETQIREAWTANKPDAYLLLCIERARARCPWTAHEAQRLAKIFRGLSGFIPPG